MEVVKLRSVSELHTSGSFWNRQYLQNKLVSYDANVIGKKVNLIVQHEQYQLFYK